MSAKVTLLCAPERIYARDHDGTDAWAFGFNLSIAASDATVNDTLLKPWKWPSLVTAFDVWIQDTNTILTNQASATLQWDQQPITPRKQFPGRQAIEDYYDKKYSDILQKSPTDLAFAPSAGQTDVRTGHNNWPALLADLSQRAAPLPHLLNLCFYIRIPRAAVAANKSICIAPLLPAGILDGAGVATPTASAPQPVPGGSKIMAWSYNSPFNGVEIEAQTELITLTDAPAKNGILLDLGRLLVRGDDPVKQFNDDWRPQAEQRLASSLDLSALLIIYLRKNLDLDAASANAIRIAAISTLRDSTGAGIRAAPDGRSLLEKLSREVFDPAKQTKLEQTASKMFGSADQWRKDLRDWLPPGTKTLTALQDDVSLPTTEVARQLECLHEAMLQRDVLPAVVQKQWSQLRDNGAPFISPDLVPPADIRQQLAMETAGPIWRSFTVAVSAATDRSTVRNALQTAIVTYYTQRLTNASPNFYPTVNLGTVPPKLQQILADAAKTAAAAAIPDQGEVVKTTSTPHGITIQVDRLSSQSDHDDDDLLRKVKGVGLLMREQAGNWTCLNMASIQVQRQDPNDPKKKLTNVAFDPVLASSRLMYVNDLGQPTLTYNNNPLGARSPLASATDVELNGEDSVGSAPPDLFVYQYSSAAKIMALYYGRQPLTLPFIVSNAGILPPELTVDSPIQLRSDLAGINESKLTGYVRSLSAYKRLVKVGHIRTTLDSNPLPVIPDGVLPRGREIDVNTFASEMPISGDPHLNRSLLLLALPSATSTVSYQFSIRQPAVDLQTWDRFAGQSTDPTVRRQVWSYWYKKEQITRLGSAGLPQSLLAMVPKDTSIDDPALAVRINAQVSRYFYAELKLENGTHAQGSPAWVAIQDSTATGPFSSVQSMPVTVIVSTGEKTGLTVGAGSISVTVAKGDLCQLQICAAVHNSNVSKFPDNQRGTNPIWDWHFPKKEDGTDATPVQGEKYALVAPFNLLIESATDALPTPQDLWNALIVSPNTAGRYEQEGCLSVKCQTDLAGWGKWVTRMEVMKQVWQWSGRPVRTHPALTGSTDPVDLDRWEAEEFGGRPESDHVVLPMSRSKTTPGLFLYQEDLSHSTDRRGLHLRFRVRAYSRYGPMLPVAQSYTDSANAKSIEDILPGSPASVRWKASFVPSRRTSDVPPVRINFILPLTNSKHDDPISTPGLMVLISDPWFEAGGLGEELESEVVLARDPNCPNDQPCTLQYFQTGPDPIINKWMQGMALATKQPQSDSDGQKATVQFIKIEGPVGHTFDRQLAKQLFLRSSFILPAPSITRGAGAPDTKLWWNFSQVRFRRKIALPLGAGSAYSDYTPGFWVQYLPDFSMFETGSTSISDLTLIYQDPSQLALVDRSNAPHTLTAVTSDVPQFALFLALTRRVFDAVGSQGQEEFVGIYEQNGGNWTPLKGFAAPGSTEEVSLCRARILEVQAHPDAAGKPPGFSSLTDFWDHLLSLTDDSGHPIEDRLRARIVRISEPIDSADFKLARC